MKPQKNKKGVPSVTSQTSPSDSGCLICQKIDRQCENLIDSLYKKIREKMKNQGEAYDEGPQKDDKSNYQKNFKNLIDVMFGRKFSQAQRNCSHITLCANLQKRLRCSQRNLSKTCEQILVQLGSKSFQIDLLKKQFSNIEKHSFLMTAQKQESEPLSLSQLKIEQDLEQTPIKNHVKVQEKSIGQVKQQTPTMGQTSPQGSNMQQGGYVFVPVFPIHGFYQQDPTMPYPNNQQQQ